MIAKILIKMDGQHLMKRTLVSMLVIENLKENLKFPQILAFKLLKRALLSLTEKILIKKIQTRQQRNRLKNSKLNNEIILYSCY